MVVAAASMVMDKCTEFYPVEGEIFSAERVVVPGVLEVAVDCYPGGGEGDGGANEEFSVEGGEGSFNKGKKQNERCNNSAVHGWVKGSRSLLQISKKYN